MLKSINCWHFNIISMINTTSERFKARNLFICRNLMFMSSCNFVLSSLKHEKSYLTSLLYLICVLAVVWASVFCVSSLGWSLAFPGHTNLLFDKQISLLAWCLMLVSDWTNMAKLLILLVVTVCFKNHFICLRYKFKQFYNTDILAYVF